MTATPQYGTMVFIGARTKMSYIKDIYISDVLNALINWDGGAGASATSPQDWTPPEPVILRDFSVVTGTADTTKLQLTRNGLSTGDFLRYVIHLTSLALRPSLSIVFGAMGKIQAIQR